MGDPRCQDLQCQAHQVVHVAISCSSCRGNCPTPAACEVPLQESVRIERLQFARKRNNHWRSAQRIAIAVAAAGLLLANYFLTKDF